ncbi:MAG: CHAP domain-containing protein [Lachnospiraceae bacterium]|nr:CHAP domain-containing protein [Lachnospiraceae bacterium]
MISEAGCVWNFQGVPWCMTFIFAVFIQTYGYEETVKILGRPWPGTRTVARRMRRHGRWREPDYIPSPGDLIFLAPDGRISHAGIVEAVRGGQVISIDGNTVDPYGRIPAERGGAVARRERPIGDPWIVGYSDMRR